MPDKLVERYLKHLDVELDDLPRDRRREIVDEIAGHITEARAGLEFETEADVRNILEGLGDPADIAVDARERFEVRPQAPVPSYKPGWIEIGALVLLLIGGIVIPIFGWLIGAVLLWVSNAWNIRDKIIGTIFVPGGLGLSIFLFLWGAGLSSGGGVALSTDCEVDPATGREFNCINQTQTDHVASSTGVVEVLGIVLFVAIVVAPFITTAYLTYRLRHQPAAATA
jgi:HAAS